MIADPDASIQADNGDSISTAWLLIGLIAIPEIGLRVICALSFFIWLNRAYNNLPVIGARNLQHSPGWAVGWWFIPFANFVKPFQVVREIYAESAPAHRNENGDVALTPASFEIIGFWWAAFLLFGFALRISDRLADESPYFPVLYMVGHILMGVAAVLCAMIIRTINSWQMISLVRITSGEQFVPPPPPDFSTPNEQQYGSL